MFYRSLVVEAEEARDRVGKKLFQKQRCLRQLARTRSPKERAFIERLARQLLDVRALDTGLREVDEALRAKQTFIPRECNPALKRYPHNPTARRMGAKLLGQCLRLGQQIIARFTKPRKPKMLKARCDDTLKLARRKGPEAVAAVRAACGMKRAPRKK